MHLPVLKWLPTLPQDSSTFSAIFMVSGKNHRHYCNLMLTKYVALFDMYHHIPLMKLNRLS